ncbi:BapA prefix-like domain-containing protein, partial [Acinetobacter sp. 187]|uniref:GA-like domain-containing protein n=1 Tax=Acinetobacter lanii TaxID=2715163 RepID=UPI00140A8C2E
MPTVQVISQQKGSVIETTDSNRINLAEKADIKVDINFKHVEKIERQGQAAVIILDNGEQIIIENFFDYPIDSQKIFFEGDDGSLYWAEFTDSAGVILDNIIYNPITESFLNEGVVPWLIGAALGGAVIAVATNQSNGSLNVNNSDSEHDIAEKLIKNAEDTYKNALNKINDAQKDGLITPAEQQAIQDAVDAANKAEKTAQDAVNALPGSIDKDGLQDRLDDLIDLLVPAVNDQDGNGIDDVVDSFVADVEAAVGAAEQAYTDAATALATAKADDLINPTEVAQLEQALKDAQQAKADAQAAVGALPAEVQEVIDDFQERLDALTDIVIPAVNDANNNGIDDSTEDPLTLAEDLVDAVEQAHQAAENVIADAQKDGLITPAEQQAIQDAVDAANKAEKTAQDAVNALPGSID